MTTQTAEPKRCCAHDSDCAVHNMPAYPAGPCDCSLNVEQVAMKLLPPFPSEADRREAAAMLRSQAAEIERLRLDAERIDWIQRHLFGHKWNGVIDSGSKTTWDIWSGFRHITQTMVGNTFREAIDAARAALETGK